MTTLRLSGREQQQIAAAQRTLLSPLAYESLTAWRGAVQRELETLLGADSALSVLPVPGEPLSYSVGNDVSDYGDWLEPLNRGLPMWQRSADLKAFSRAQLWAPLLDEYLASSYYNEFVIGRVRGYQAAGLATRVSRARSIDGIAQIIVNRCARAAPSFSQRDVAMLHLLQPAFAAAVNISRQYNQRAESLVRTIDQLGVGAMLATRDGGVVHATAALEGTFDGDAQAPLVLRAMRELLFRMLDGARAGSPTHGMQDRVVRTAAGSYRLGASFLDQESFGSTHLMVTVRRCDRRAARQADLGKRFGFTPREAAVALRLAAGESNRAIADALSISPHTARHHTESVLAKLGLSSRAGVAARLFEGPEAAGRAD